MTLFETTTENAGPAASSTSTAADTVTTLMPATGL
jgi:hypothetical protein